MDDPFIRDYIEDLLKNIRTLVLLKLIRPYTRIEISFISKQAGRARAPRGAASADAAARSSTSRRPRWSRCWCR